MIKRHILIQQRLRWIRGGGLPSRDIRIGIEKLEVYFGAIGQVPVVFGEDLVAFFFLDQVVEIGELEIAGSFAWRYETTNCGTS